VTVPLRLSVRRSDVPLPGTQSPRTALRISVRVPSELDAVEEAVDVVARHCIAAGLSARRARFNLRVALCEALANAMIYGNGLDPDKAVEVHVTVTEIQLRIEVADEGNGFNPAHFDDVSLPDDLEATGGRGLFLIRKLVDDVYLNERGNTICMVLRRA
jgi:anti-sigma regulatory factor (Ser/Thr protein kinase)